MEFWSVQILFKGMVISASFNKPLSILQCSHYKLSKNDILVGKQFTMRNWDIQDSKLFFHFGISALGVDFATQ